MNKNNFNRQALLVFTHVAALVTGLGAMSGVAVAQSQKAQVTPKAVAPPSSIVKPATPTAQLLVPSVIGLHVAEATERLARFTVQTKSVPSVRAPGTVIAQDPQPTPRPAKSVVILDVSDGSRVLVPNVGGRREADARARLTTNDLVVRVESREADQTPGTIVEQNPPPGTEVDRPSTVELAVSTGLGLPKVVGESIDEARRQLARFTVEFSIIESAELERSVVSQDPSAGARVPAGTRVRLVVSDGSMVAVPDLQSTTLETARAMLRDAGLVIAVRGGPDVGVAVVKAQSPVARNVVKRGTQVDLETRAPVAWTVTGLAALSLLIAAGIWQWRRAPRTPVPQAQPAELPHLIPPSVRATVDLDKPESHIGSVELAGPPVRLAVGLENEQSSLRTTSGDPQ
jgi:beta-lactam-binding protein with PASTA domain